MDLTDACWRVLNRLVLDFYRIVSCNSKMTVVSHAITGYSLRQSLPNRKKDYTIEYNKLFALVLNAVEASNNSYEP